VVKQLFYAAGYQAMSTLWAMRGLAHAAKSAVSLPITNMKLPAGKLFPQVSKFCLNEWQEIWDCCEGNKLWRIAKICRAMILYLSTDSTLVILD